MQEGSIAAPRQPVQPSSRVRPLAGLRYAKERVHHVDAGKAAKIAVARPKLTDTMLPAQGGDAGILDLWSGDPAVGKQFPQRSPMQGRFAQQNQSWGPSPGLNLIKGAGQGRRRVIDAGMGYHREKFMQAWPRNSP